MSNGTRLMLVDDDPVESMALERALRRISGDHAFEHVEDPLTASDRLEAFAPEVVLVDMSMPACSGVDVVKALRATARGATVRIHGYSNSVSPHDRDAVLAAGADGYRTKPNTFGDMQQFLRELLDVDDS